MKRSRRMQTVLVVCVCVLGAGLSTAVADETPTPACELGYELRVELGYGPNVLAALGVDEATHTTLANAATAHCEQHREAIEPLLAAVSTAKKNAFRQYELAGDVEATDAALVTAVTALRAGCSEILATLHNALSADQRTKQAHLVANYPFDVHLALLELTEAQRTSLKAAQRARDLALRHHKDRKNLLKVKEALDAFTAEVDAVLTTEQKTASAEFETALRQNLTTVMEREATLCESAFAPVEE